MVTFKQSERVILVGIIKSREDLPDGDPLKELEDLVASAGGIAVEKILQKRTALDAAYLIGRGKAEEIGDLAQHLDVHAVVFDEELSPKQQRNLEDLINVKIIDRTRLILDVFAQRARTKEGMLQVELAQNTYMLSRLTGRGTQLSQQLGGIGTRGPGERALEYDRRRIRAKIQQIKKELTGVGRERDTQRAKRLNEGIPQVAIVGYTNVGKSSLLNRLAIHHENGVRPAYADDRLFATLDPLTKRVYLPSNLPILVTDTVGFIRKLPTHLVASFRATLEEIKWADIILVIEDPTLEPQEMESRRQAVNEILQELKVMNYPSIHLFSKADLLTTGDCAQLKQRSPNFGFISSTTGEGIPELLRAIENRLVGSWPKTTLLVPANKGHLISVLYATGKVLEFKPGKKGGYKILWRAPKPQIARIQGLIRQS